jgi:DNA-binding NarL/FixJ family response regulator
MKISRVTKLRKSQIREISESQKPYIKIVKLLAEGHTLKDAAKVIGLSSRTIEEYSQDLRDITGCKTLPQLTTTFIKNQIISI